MEIEAPLLCVSSARKKAHHPHRAQEQEAPGVKNGDIFEPLLLKTKGSGFIGHGTIYSGDFLNQKCSCTNILTSYTVCVCTCINLSIN